MTQINPNIPPAHQLVLQGIEHHTRGDIAQALTYYEQAQQLAPNDAIILNALGAACQDMGHVPQAMVWFSAAQKADPADALAYRNMSQLFIINVHYSKALVCLKQALKFNPNHAELWHDIAKLLSLMGLDEECREAFAQLRKIAPNTPLIDFEALKAMPSIWQSAQQIDAWRAMYEKKLKALPQVKLERMQTALEKTMANTDFRLSHQGRDNLALRQQYNEKFIVPSVTFAPRAPSSKLRVGLFVGAFYENVFLKMLGGMWNTWQHEDIELTLIGAAVSQQKFAQAIPNPRIGRLTIKNEFRSALEAIRAAQFDIVYFWEVGTHPINFFLPLFRTAPIQCTSWGSVESTGMKSVDWFATSRLQEGDQPQQHYSERVHLLDHLPSYMSKPDAALYRKFSRQDLGIDASRPVFALPHQLWKIHPEMDGVIGALMQQNPDARLVCMESSEQRITEPFRARLLAATSQNADRVIMLPYQDYAGYLTVLALSDVVLDTFHYSGGQTTLETLACGTPVVTLPGDAMRSRSTHACYRQMKIGEEMIAHSPQEYIAKATSLASDAALNAKLRAQILDKNAILYENPAVSDDHAAFFRAMAN